MRQADPGPLQAGWFQTGLLQRLLSEAQASQGTQKILNRSDYQFNQSVFTNLCSNGGNKNAGSRAIFLQISSYFRVSGTW
jgi:hypothetical protein